MSLTLERGVPQEERRNISLGGLTDWDAARIFLELVRCGSFRSAAERLDLSINVVRRRIDDFERQVGATLFTRDDEVEAQWRIIDPILEAWHSNDDEPLPQYEAGTQGPEEAERILIHGDKWRSI